MESILRTIRHLIVGAAATAAIGVPLWFVITAFGGKYGLWTRSAMCSRRPAFQVLAAGFCCR